MSNPKEYKTIAKFLSLFLGNNCEVLLCDTEEFLYIMNPLDDTHHVGDPLDDLHQNFIDDDAFHSLPYTITYRTSASSGEKLRSATFFIRDDNTLTGFLTLNWKITDFVQMKEILEMLTNGSVFPDTEESTETGSGSIETLSSSVSELINSVMNEARIRFQTTPDRFTTEEKLSIIREMNKRGVFLVKGSVSEVAKEVRSSEPTIYRYLNQINNTQEEKS